MDGQGTGGGDGVSDTNKKPSNFDWVTARSECLPRKVLEALRLQVETDIKTRNDLSSPASAYRFSMVSELGIFSVLIEGPKLHDSVIFSIADGGILVRNTTDKWELRADLTISNDGECRLKCDGQEYEFWQFRKLPLSDCFLDVHRGSDMNSIEKLRDLIRKEHGLKVNHLESVPIKEMFRGQTVWDGIVEVFEIIGHPKATRVFAWSHATDDPANPVRHVTVLNIRPVVTPLDAVRVLILRDYKGQYGEEA